MEEVINYMNNVAICMATYNGENYIDEQITSIIEQTYQNWILFIRDDGSSDDTVAHIRRFLEQYPDKIKMIEEPELLGGSSKKNFSAIVEWVKDHYNFGYFMFADQDDVWLPDKVQKMLVRMQAEEKSSADGAEPILLFTDYYVADADLKVMDTAVRDSVKEFVGEAPQFDDITMLTLRYNGASKAAD